MRNRSEFDRPIFPVEVGIHADAKTVTDELCKMLETHKSKKEVQDWLDTIQRQIGKII